MRYDFSCPRCGAVVEVVRPMSQATEPLICTDCNVQMQREFTGVRISKGHKQYSRPIVSDSLAINSEQVAEHRRLFPNIQLADDGSGCHRPVLDNYTDHEDYLNKCNIVKQPKSKKKKGKRIA